MSAAAPPEDLRANIAKLKQEAAALKAEKMKVGKALRNAEKKRARLKRKARELTDSDLLQVLKLREDLSGRERGQKRRLGPPPHHASLRRAAERFTWLQNVLNV